MTITAQEAWLAPRRRRRCSTEVPGFVAEVVEEIAFQARQDRRIDKRSGVSQRLPISAMENVVSNAERRALVNGEEMAVPRVTDIYAALPSITGKFELEYEGELKGAEAIARELIRAAVANVADGYLSHLETRQVIEWFDLGGSLQLWPTRRAPRTCSPAPARSRVSWSWRTPPGFPPNAPAPLLASGVDFVLEGLYAMKKIGRSDERGLSRHRDAGAAARRARRRSATIRRCRQGGKKKYYN